MPIRPTKHHRNRQRQAIRLFTVSASLLLIQHQHFLCIPGTSTIQRTSGSHQQNHQENAEEQAGSRQGQLACHATRGTAQLRNATYKQRTAQYYDSRIKHRSFKVGDWVLRKVSLATRNPTKGTLAPPGRDLMKLSASADPTPTDCVAPMVTPLDTLGMLNI
ncbi:unnamed protein product [Prunus armeniaca]